MLFSHRRRDDDEDINISPLIDMVFILLIFFVVTATFTRETGVSVHKPKASSAQELRKKTVMIAVTTEGTIHINEKQVSTDHLLIILRNTLRESPESDAVIIADRESRMDTVVRVMDTCTLAGIKKVSIGALKK